MNEEEKRRVLAEIVELAEPPMLRPTDVTLEDYMAATGASYHAARYRLDRLIEEGKCESLLVYCPRRCRMVRAWRRVKDGSET